MICGIGRGDSSVRAIKRRPANLDRVEEAVNIIRTVGSGQAMEIEGTRVHLEWGRGADTRLSVAKAPVTTSGSCVTGFVTQVPNSIFSFCDCPMSQPTALSWRIPRRAGGVRVRLAA